MWFCAYGPILPTVLWLLVMTGPWFQVGMPHLLNGPTLVYDDSCFVEGEVQDANAIETHTVTSRQECKDICDTHTECIVATLINDETTCLIQERFSSFGPLTDPSVTTYYKFCGGHAEGACFVQGARYRFFDLAKKVLPWFPDPLDGPSAIYDCLQWCRDTPGCTSANYNFETNPVVNYSFMCFLHYRNNPSAFGHYEYGVTVLPDCYSECLVEPVSTLVNGDYFEDGRTTRVWLAGESVE